MKGLEFDVVVHLAGEQIVPNYVALKLTEANRPILLTISRTKKQVDALRRMFEGIERKRPESLRNAAHGTAFCDTISAVG